MNFLVNYVSIWEKEWFIGILTLLFDIVTVGFLLFIVGAMLIYIVFTILDL